MQFINQFSFSYTLFLKYSDVFASLQLIPISQNNNGIIELMKSFGWLLYVNSRREILKSTSDIVLNALLILSVLNFLFLAIPGCLSSNLLAKLSENKQKYKDNVLNHLATIFKIQPQEELLQEMMKQFESYVSNLTQGNILNFQSEPEIQFTIDINFLTKNISNLSILIGTKLQIEDLDERIFVMGPGKVSTPNKISNNFTPFARQGNANKRSSSPKKNILTSNLPKTLSSQRKLNFDSNSNSIPKTGQTVVMVNKMSDINFPSKIKSSPFISTDHLPSSTPITKAMEMSNWLMDHIKKVIMVNSISSGIARIINLTKPSLDLTEKLIQKILDEFLNKVSGSLGSTLESCTKKANLIKMMFFKIIDDMILEEEKKLSNDQFIGILSNDKFFKSLVACSAETVLFVHNIITISFEQILFNAKVSPFDFWKIISPFLRFDSKIPTPLKKHFREIEMKIISFLAWQSSSPLFKVIQKIISKEEQQRKSTAIKVEMDYSLDSSKNEENDIQNIDKMNDKSNTTLEIYLKDEPNDQKSIHDNNLNIAPYELFFKRILHFVSQRIVNICDSMKLKDDLTREQIWEIMKYILSIQIDLLYDRQIDVLIICSVYAICKMRLGTKYSFNSIIDCYIRFNHNEIMHQCVFYKVKLNDKNEGDIIKFYNMVYIPKCKDAISNLCKYKAIPQYIHKPLIKFLSPASKLNENLPPAVFLYPYNISQGNTVIGGRLKLNNLQPTKNMMTPRTQLLFATGDTPIITHKAELQTIPEEPLSSSKVNNFKQELISAILNSEEKKGENDNIASNMEDNKSTKNQGRPPLPISKKNFVHPGIQREPANAGSKLLFSQFDIKPKINEANNDQNAQIKSQKKN